MENDFISQHKVYTAMLINCCIHWKRSPRDLGFDKIIPIISVPSLIDNHSEKDSVFIIENQKKMDVTTLSNIEVQEHQRMFQADLNPSYETQVLTDLKSEQPKQTRCLSIFFC